MDMKKTAFAFTSGAGAFAAARAVRARRRIDFRGRTVLITGGSRGLGLALARHFAMENANLALLARTADDLEKAEADLALRDPSIEVHTATCDVRKRDEVEAAVAGVVERFGRLDVLVNNAGVIQVGPVEHMEEADFAEAMDVHFWGAYHATEAALPYLKMHRESRIVNVASIAGQVAVPHLAPYVASKFALVGYSDAMRAELAKYGVRVTTVLPGLMRTGSHVNALFKGRHEEEFAWFATSDAQPLLSASTQQAAREMLEACRYGDAELVITLPAKLAVRLSRLFPGLTAAAATLAERFLPAATGAEGDERRSGWKSFSDLAPSKLTRPADQAIARNNQQRGRPAPA